MRLTADILLRAESYINPYSDRELNLRGFKIPAVENLSVLQDQFDAIDFSDNDIKKLDNFPVMNRLSAVFFNNNSITRIGSNLGQQLPKLNAIILTNNKVANLSEINHLATAKHLEILSLLENPVTHKSNYRLYAIFRIPTLKWLDYRKVQQTERDESAKFFKTSIGKQFAVAVENEEKLIAEAGSTAAANTKAIAVTLTEEQKMQVKLAIEMATTKEQIDLIEKQLKEGSFDFKNCDDENKLSIIAEDRIVESKSEQMDI